MPHRPDVGSGWTRVEEIVAYQLSVELRDRVLALIDANTIPHNFRYREDMAAAARSAPANIAEGFERYRHGQFGFHAGVAKGSLGELKSHLEEARARKFISDATAKSLIELLISARKTTSGLIRHLRTTEAPEPIDPRTTEHFVPPSKD